MKVWLVLIGDMCEYHTPNYFDALDHVNDLRFSYGIESKIMEGAICCEEDYQL